MATYLECIQRLRNGGVFSYELLEKRDGFISVLFEGESAKKTFADESGGHRFQRIPPTEKKGRVHTSTVTVAVLDAEENSGYKLDLSDVEIRTTRGSGPGGQNRNMTDSCVIATHKPTGTSVRIDTRSQTQNKGLALKTLSSRLAERQSSEQKQNRDSLRKDMVGSGQRGDKIRTYSEPRDSVVDHKTGKRWNLKQWMKGNW